MFDKLLQLHQRRKQREDKEAEIKLANFDVAMTPEYQRLSALRSDLEVIDSELKEIREEITLEGLEQYAEHPESKEIVPGVNVRVKTTLVYDLTLAEAWCWQHFPLAFRLDTKMFEDQMKDLLKEKKNGNADRIPPFVKFLEEPTITISVDLSKFLKEADHATDSSGQE